MREILREYVRVGPPGLYAVRCNPKRAVLRNRHSHEIVAVLQPRTWQIRPNVCGVPNEGPGTLAQRYVQGLMSDLRASGYPTTVELTKRVQARGGINLPKRMRVTVTRYYGDGRIGIMISGVLFVLGEDEYR